MKEARELGGVTPGNHHYSIIYLDENVFTGLKQLNTVGTTIMIMFVTMGFKKDGKISSLTRVLPGGYRTAGSTEPLKPYIDEFIEHTKAQYKEYGEPIPETVRATIQEIFVPDGWIA
jgi:hypothetical protein